MANFDKKWSELSQKESREMKDKYGSRSAWQEAKQRANNRQQQSKDWGDGNTLTGQINKPETPKPGQSPAAPSNDWGPGNTLTGPINNPETPKPGQSPAAPKPAPAPTPTQPTPTPSPTQPTTPSPTPEPTPKPTNTSDTNAPLPRISTQMEGYATDRKYTGPDGKMYTAKEADDAGWTAGYYDYGGGAYVPKQKTFDNPHSPEAIAYRQQYAKDTSRDGKYAVGMEYVSKDDPRRMYDASANVGYETDLTPGQGLKEWHMGKAYKQKMEEEGIDWDAYGGYHNYDFDMTKGYFVPNQSLRQQRARMWDNTYMREADRGTLGDRNSYIHQYYDPLNGSFEYDNTYDMQ